METPSPTPDPDHVHIWRWMVPVKTVLKVVVAVGVVLIAVSAVLWLQNNQIRHNQAIANRNQAAIEKVTAAADCWDRVLVVALHDHLTAAERVALINEANGCANLTK